MTLKRESRAGRECPARAPRPANAPDSARRPPRSDRPSAAALDAYKYVGFEDQFRGSQEAIRARLESLSAALRRRVGRARRRLRTRRVPRSAAARGIARARHRSESRDGRRSAARAGSTSPKPTPSSYLVGAARRVARRHLLAAQVVEHLQPGYLLRFLELAFHKLRPGGRLVLETLNPACWVAFFDSYIRDITHVWPLHPETLKYLVLASGFTTARDRVPLAGRRRRIASSRLPSHARRRRRPRRSREAFNANVEKLNARMFTYLDYAVVGDKAP